MNQEKQTEEVLKESEDRFFFMTNVIPQQVWTAGSSGMLDFVNEYACNYFGKSAEEIVGEGWQSVVHPDDLRVSLEKWQASLKEGIPYELEFRLRNCLGEYRWHLARAIAYKQGDIILKWFGTNTDIEDQKKINQQKDDFITIASHELKTPVTTLYAYLQILRKNPPFDIQQKILAQSSKSMDSIAGLIDGLLNASHMKKGKLELSKTRFKIADLINECCMHIRLDTDHELIFEGDDNLDIVADELRINQVIVNLVTNAVKYAPQSKVIHFQAEEDTGIVRISVRDEGPGIPPEQIPMLFDRYYQGEKNGSVYSGLGLGLYICSEIIKSHDGDIGVNSEVGKGTTFWFTLPVK